MTEQPTITAPKPFVFVLMPFADGFQDIYKFGIKGASEEAGAYAERIDEQIFSEGILERIFNQINKADVVVADMTGRNPNVFYEVGYAHALGKIVLLLTQNADDIPFDLKQRQHIVYGGKIEKLKEELANRIVWAIAESRARGGRNVTDRFLVSAYNKEVPEGVITSDTPVVEGMVQGDTFHVQLCVSNGSLETTESATHIYLLTSEEPSIVPCTTNSTHFMPTDEADAPWSYKITGGSLGYWNMALPTELEPLQVPGQVTAEKLTNRYRLRTTLPPMPPGATEALSIDMMFRQGAANPAEELLVLRIHTSTRHHEFPFRLRITRKEEEPAEEKVKEQKPQDS